MRLIKSTPKGKQRVYDIEVADVHNFYANGINVHNCATAGGVSVIKDDGSVVNSTSNATYHAKKIKILPNGELYHTQGTSPASNEGLCFNIPFTRISGVDLGTYANSTTFWYGSAGIGNTSNILGSSTLPLTDVVNSSDSLSAYTANSSGLSQISISKESLTRGMVAYATTSYSSGWMHGDIKGAWLSDTSTTSVTGTELVTNGTFAGNLNGWTLAGDITPTYDSATGGAKITSAASVDGNITQTITSTAGVVVTFSITARTSGFVGLSLNGSLVLDGLTALQTYTYYPDNAITSIALVHRGSGGGYAIVDNVSIRREELDRSVNNRGLAVYGTITKTAVATGADLVAYSGFSGSNYLLNTSSYNFGSPSLCIMGWFKFTDVSDYQYIGSVFDSTSVQIAGVSFYQSTGTMYLFDTNAVHQSTKTFNDGNWHFATAIFNGSQRLGYVDGELVINSSNTSSLTLTNVSRLSVGHYIYNNAVVYNFTGSLSLVRFSTSAPSPEQILKIYNDEKMLFQENSQATLYGASDAVTALAYDDTTKLLSVGTSSGRSDFSGLKRINNTTTAVTTAISASNGLIAEQ